MSDLKERYIALKKNAIDDESAKRLRFLYIVILVLLILNYFLAFTDLYITLFRLVPAGIHNAMISIYANLSEIRSEMLKRGDLELFLSYSIFSTINLALVVFAPVVAIFIVKIRSLIGVPPWMKFYPYYIFLMLVIFLCAVLILNKAGYNNHSRLLVYPSLGQGVFFFLRDTVFYYLIVFSAIELVIAVRLATHEGE